VRHIAHYTPSLSGGAMCEFTGEQRQRELGLVVRRPRLVVVAALQIVEVDLPVARAQAGHGRHARMAGPAFTQQHFAELVY
jgi:hypothetical protein